MTLDEAIRILDPKTTLEALFGLEKPEADNVDARGIGQLGR